MGDFGVGKTTLLHQYLERRFTPNVATTIGSNFFVKRLKIPKIQGLITLQIWDLAGQEHFKWVRHEFYKGAKGIVYVFDLTDKKTFENLYNWKKEIYKVIEGFSSVLVGNKLDLVNSENQEINNKESDNLKKFLGVCGYFEASAKLGTSVEDLFLKLVTHINRKYSY